MKQIEICIGIVFLTIINIVAITSQDLPYPRSPEQNKIISNISPLESLFVDWSPKWNNQFQEDTVRSILYSAIEDVEKKNEESFENNLLKSILWLHLYKTSVDTAFLKMKDIAYNLQQSYPERFESSWIKGITQILGTEIDSGFKLLDKIRIEQNNLPDNFFNDYSTLSELVFLPQELNWKRGNKSINLNFLPFKTVDLNINDRFPVSSKWSVTNDFNNPESFPLFTFSADFNLKKSFKIKPILTKRKQDFKINIPLKSHIQKELKDSLIYNPDGAPIKMSMNILINKIDSMVSLDRHMLNFVYKQYDEIKPIKLSEKNMILLKCLNKSIYRDMDDEYVVYLAFDKPLDLKDKSLYDLNFDHKNPSTVRYIVALKTSKSVEEKADMLLYELAEKLIR